jgi:small subunit ribosomal protein S8
MVTDPVGDFIIRLKNASMVGKEFVIVPYSKLKFEIAQKLLQSGYAKTVSKRGKKTRKYIEIELLYKKKDGPKISGVSRKSKPGKRIYKRAMNIYPIKAGRGILILSTPKGILTGEEARKEKVGGEELFTIW